LEYWARAVVTIDEKEKETKLDRLQMYFSRTKSPPFWGLF
jgi:hypothetical protein